LLGYHQAQVILDCFSLLAGDVMSDPEKPDRRPPSVESQRQQAAAIRETNRPADSTPVVAGQFAKLPAAFGRYQVEKLLGRGAMGAVYLARDTQLDRLVALKIPKVAASGSKKLLLRLETEAKSAAKLDHPSLCKVHDAGEINGQCFIAMQYIEGETLKTQLEAKSKSVEESVALIVQLAEGLSEAHALGIIHRDLKPENIMINRRGTPVIMDFGLAKMSTITGNAAVTQAGTILGSPAYMSPEQANGNLKEIDQRSDIYLLGIIFFELLTGQWPFSGSAMQILGQKSVADPISPINLRPSLPPQLATICCRMIARLNADRYQSLADLIADLKRVDLSHAPATVSHSAVQSIDPPMTFPDFAPSSQFDERLASVAKRPAASSVEGARNSIDLLLNKAQGARGWWNDQSPVIRWAIVGGSGGMLIAFGILLLLPTAQGTRQVAIDGIRVPKKVVAVSKRLPRKPAQPDTVVEPQPAAQPSSISLARSARQDWPEDAPPPAIAPFERDQATAHQKAWAKYLELDVEFTNSIGMKFVLIPPGEFLMGGRPDEVEAMLALANQAGWEWWTNYIRSEAPQHRVYLTRPIYLGTHEVTQGQYQKIMGKNPSHFAATGPGSADIAGIDSTHFPVEMVSRSDAAEFCAKLSELEKRPPSNYTSDITMMPPPVTGYRLPTEAEWEFACRAGTSTIYWCGDPPANLMTADWTRDNSGLRPHPVGELLPNPFGVYDLHGNVFEWVRDAWDATYYFQFQAQPAVNPSGPFSQGSLCVIRGGSWFDGTPFCRAAYRFDRESLVTGNNIGFRVSLPAVKTKSVSERNPQQVRTGIVRPAKTPALANVPFSSDQAKAHQQAWASYLGMKVVEQNSVGIDLVLVPPGKFMMGSPATEAGREVNEVPVSVTLTQPIYFGKTEVTQAQWSAVMGTQPWKAQVYVKEQADCPATYVNWEDSQAFCAKLSSIEGVQYRLPTEAEWEYACRAGTTTRYYFGDDQSQLGQYAWFRFNAADPRDEFAHQVGQLLPNPFGLYDMHGNVWEWCEDWYVDHLPGGENPVVSSGGSVRVNRSGGWRRVPEGCRSAFRNQAPQVNRGNINSFRVVRVVSDE